MTNQHPFIHGEEGTHTACQKRIDEEGGKATCCYCRPHDGCELRKSMTNQTTIREKIAEQIAGAIGGEVACSQCLSEADSILSLLRDAVAGLMERHRHDSTLPAPHTEEAEKGCMMCTRNQALSDCIAMIKKEL